VPAIVLISIGAIFLLSNLHIVYFREWLRYWPAILVAVGIVKLVDSQDTGGRVGGGILVGAGAILLGRELGFIDVRLWDLWPLVLIALGIGMLFGKTPFMADARHTDTGNSMRESAVFSGGKRTITTQDFQGGKIDAVFGGYEIDLRQASMTGPSAQLELNAVFGGIEMKVPHNWNVVSRGTGVFGAFVDNTQHPDPRVCLDIKELVLKGGAVFGGVEIKN
jgi:predicted membrane protein